jgi:UDPglucose 6-dehydrogenase
MKTYKIAVAGTGYVGMSIATLLAQHHQVIAVDVIPEKVEKINHRVSPIQDEYIEKYLAEKPLNLTATLDGATAYRDADFVVIAAPTNYDPAKNFFDTHHIEDVIDLVLSVNPEATMVIKSTIPVGYCRSLYVKYAQKFAQMVPLPDGKRREFHLLFSPEFLRESKALEDNLYPSRIIVGYPKMMSVEWEEENEAIRKIQGNHMKESAEIFAKLLQEGAIKENIDTLFMGLKEAEAVKLFANTYLALRVSYFNELDTYAEVKGLDSAAIIKAIGDKGEEKSNIFLDQSSIYDDGKVHSSESDLIQIDYSKENIVETLMDEYSLLEVELPPIRVKGADYTVDYNALDTAQKLELFELAL